MKEMPSVDFWPLHVHTCTHSHIHKRNHCLNVVRATAGRHSRSIQKVYQEVWGLVRDITSKGTNEESALVHLKPAYLLPSSGTRKGHDQGQAKEARVRPEQGRSTPVYTASYGGLAAHPCLLPRSFRHDKWIVAFPSADFLIGSNQGFGQSLSIIRVGIRIQTSPITRSLHNCGFQLSTTGMDFIKRKHSSL